MARRPQRAELRPPRRAGPLPPRPEEPEAAPGLPRHDLLAKYRTTVQKYEDLVRRYAGDSSDRSAAVTLALAAVRASRSGLALYGAHGFLTRNPYWMELARMGETWRPLDAQGTAHDTFEGAVASLARPLLGTNPKETRVVRFARERPERVIEVRLEAVVAHARPLVIAQAEDVTDRTRAEREMARAREQMIEHERMRLLGELASGVAHDLNNTLHALSLRIGHLEASQLAPDQVENVKVLSRIVADATERVSRLQELGRRREDVPTETFDVASVIREAIAVAQSDIEERAHVAGVHFDLEADVADGGRVVGSPAELRHVFVNLLLNARDAMPRGGRIRIACHVSWGTAQVVVEDEGTGIAPEHLGRLFDPFFTTKGPLGMGLGLAIAQGVMRRLGGHIAAANRSSGGATFTLTFPVAEEEARTGEDAAPPRQVTPGHRLLVVDDDADNLEAIRWVLQDLGQSVDVAASGDEALEFLSKGRRYDLILCDVGMPNMNGWQVAEHVRRVAPDARFLLLTGWAQEISKDDPKRKLVDGILAKPLDLPGLRRVLDDRLGEPVPADSTP
jgi:signal transduction histidine kinase/ActR/RegA family two-component response regulator